MAMAEPDRQAFLGCDAVDVGTEPRSRAGADAHRGDRLETPAAAGVNGQAVPDAMHIKALLPGHRIGPYVIRSEIGRGGTGVVYRASRTDDASQPDVAIKVLRRHPGREALRQRFRQERRILANLGHPHIAGLIDGGTLDDDSPYVITEHVDGVRLDEYCEQNRLSIEGRLELFSQVCAAVHHAHQHLIVHGNLNPQNVLVTADGIPKLLDFGVAGRTGVERTGGGDCAPMATPLMPPENASPEQFRGLPVTTATDVYALGVMLYGLVSGRSPYALTAKTPDDIARAICHVEPVRPSTAAADAQARGIERQKRWEDLDAIVLKALRKEPARRYSAADQLAEDIQRHLAGLPVRAVPDSLGYRLRKLVSRNRVGVAALVAILLALLAGIVATIWQARIARLERTRAERRFDDLRKLARTVIFDMHDAIAHLPGSTAAREVLVTGALEYLDGLAGEAANDRTLQRELADAYERVADVLGRPTASSPADFQRALETYRKAQAIRERLGSAGSDDVEVRRSLAATGRKLTSLLWMSGDIEAATEEARRSLAIEEALSADDSSDAQRVRLAAAHDSIGYSLAMRGNSPEALERLRLSQSMLEPYANPSDPEASDLLSSVYGHIAAVLDGNAPVPGVVTDLPAALEMYNKSLAISQSLAFADPRNVATRRNVILGHLHVGEILLKLRDPQGALTNFRSAMLIADAIATEDAASMTARSDQAVVYARIGSALVQQGDADAGVSWLQRSLSLLDRVARADLANSTTRSWIAAVEAGLGDAHLAMGRSHRLRPADRMERYRQAKAFYERALAVRREQRGQGPRTGEDAALTDELLRQIETADQELAALIRGK
jgi:eukaryotic-like serine/threonine-protein kinase